MLPLYDFDLRATHARTLLPAALASVSFGFVLVRVRVRFLPSTHHPLYDFDLRATHARTLLPAALASVSFGFVLVRVQVHVAMRSNKIVSRVTVAVTRNCDRPGVCTYDHRTALQ